MAADISGALARCKIGKGLEEKDLRSFFRWKIQRFSSLLKLDLPYHTSGAFTAGGYRWKVIMYPKKMKIEDGKYYTSLYLYLADVGSLPSNMVLQTVFNLWIYDQMHNKHIVQKAVHHFRLSNDSCGFDDRISFNTFLDPSSGFLVNDCCIFGAEIIEVLAHTEKCESLSLRKEIVSQRYTCTVLDFSSLGAEAIYSDVFDSGGFKWHIVLYPKGVVTNDHISLLLEIDGATTLPLDLAVYVDFTLTVVDQINDNHWKHRGQWQFDPKDSSAGIEKFMPHHILYNPAKGFLVNDACIIEASVTVLGLVNMDD